VKAPHRYDVVVPTIGRPNLAMLLRSLAVGEGELPERVVVVDDRPGGDPLALPPVPALEGRVLVLRSQGFGPAAARNLGWRSSRSPWAVFLDDDVLITPGWRHALLDDLRVPPEVGAVQGRILAPLPRDRGATDWERTVNGLERASWITADMAVRRAALEDTGGFDERFPRAFREDADLALRLLGRGWRLERGSRTSLHLITRASPWVSLRSQAGNADDVLMEALHGPDWYERAGAPRGRIARHRLTVAAASVAFGAATLRRPTVAAAAAVVWAAFTGEFWWHRVAPGPRTARELSTMLVTSVLIPPLAVSHRLLGRLRVRQLLRGQPRAPRSHRSVDAVLFDRDGTLALDVPYNGDPELVRVVDGAPAAIQRLRRNGIRVAAVSNQSGVGRGLIDEGQVRAVNARIEASLGALDGWFCCFHVDDDHCDCRKPMPGLVLEAAHSLGVAPQRCAVVGDTGADVTAALRAGALGVLVPSAATRREEIAAAPLVAPTIEAAVDLILLRDSA
jgi:histidinol-phosphate phosphatase family protein